MTIKHTAGGTRYEQHGTPSIVRTQVTWTRWDAKALRNRTSHPYVWIWTDADGTERTFDTKADAIAARVAYSN